MRANPAAYEGFKEGVRDPDPAVRARAAACEDAPPEILYFLAQDPDVEVRRRVAANPATPPAANAMLTVDDDHSVRCEIAYKAVGDGLEGDERGRMLRMGLTILETLATDQVMRVRQALAETFKSLAGAPRQIIRMLAGDDCEAVAAPVLAHSPVLNEKDLLEILGDNPPEWAQSAIARRETVSPRVAEAIADFRSVASTAVLIRNDGAAIAEPVLERIVDAATEEEAWQEPLAKRAAMPARLLSALARFAAKPVLALLGQRRDLPPEVSEVLVLRKRTDVAAPPGAASVAVGVGAGDGKSEGAESSTDDDDSAARAQRAEAVGLHRAGKLDVDRVAAALDDGKDDFTRVALALRAGLTLQSVHHILAARNAEVITALVWKAGMSMRFAMDVQKFLARVPVRDVLNARGGVDFPLSPDKMTMLLDIFGD